MFPLIVALFTGCLVVDDHDRHPSSPPPELPPEITYAAAGCEWDPYYQDHIWWFDAEATDPNGVYDVVEVWADVYDESRGGVLVDSFEVLPTDDPYWWYSDWLEYSTHLYCDYGVYSVDFVAYDQLGDYDVVNVRPYYD